ncbi:MAG: CHAT domain-containing protein [Leptolyngbya sp. BL-A-14]
MEELRIQAYILLIKQLLSCPCGQELEVLRSNEELVDPELLRMMGQAAEQMEIQQDVNAERLRQLASQLMKILQEAESDWVKKTQDAEEFVNELMQCIAEVKGDRAQVYNFLQINLVYVDEIFLQILPIAFSKLKAANQLEVQEFIAAIFVKFGNLIQQFPKGNRMLNLELSIAAYNLALQVYTREELPEQWATTQANLASAYLDRIKGERIKNIENAITACKLALQVYTREAFLVQWAMTQLNLANAYRDRIQGERSNNLEESISIYEQVLCVLTRESFPPQWAMAQSNLGTAYSERIQGNRADNLEKAITAYKQALQIRTQQASPREWATTQNGLAIAYSNRIRGDRAENLEQAIAAYELVLQVYTYESFPQQWAVALNNLALAYSKRIRGDRADNLERAIALYEQVLQIYSLRTFPQQWAAIQNNLAIIYESRIRGKRADNLEMAINAYKQALQIYTREAHPEKWAMTQNNLAIAYGSRIRDNRAENLEMAINAYKQALQIYTREAYPEKWAMTQNNLAVTYYENIRGDRTENLEMAITTYKKALQVYNLTDFPEQWAMTQSNLANAYRDRIRGKRTDNLEMAIAIYEEALQIYSPEAFPERWAMTQNNLAAAYRDRLKGNRTDNFKRAINLYRQALQVYQREAYPEKWAMTQNNLANAYTNDAQEGEISDLESAITLYTEVLEVYTRDEFPWEWATTQNNLGSAYSSCTIDNDTGNLNKAILAYELSLQIRTPQVFPKDCRQTAYNLGNLYFQQQSWSKAKRAYALALQASEILYQSTLLLDSQAAELAEIADLPRRAAYAYAQSGDLQSAVLTLERGRARNLSETLERDRADLVRLQELAPDLYRQYAEITSQLRNLEAQQRLWMTSENRYNLTPEILRAEALQVQHALTETINKIRLIPDYKDFLSQSDFDGFISSLRSGVPLIYILSTSGGGLILIVTSNCITPLWLNALTETSLRELLDRYFNAYKEFQANYQNWLNILESITSQLWQSVMAPLIDYLKQHSYQQAVLIPIGYLSLLPLHAAWVEAAATPTGKYYALDEILLTYAPNAKSLNAAFSIAQRTRSDAILAIDNPLQDLPNSHYEVAAAVASFPQKHIFQHDAATVEAVLNVLSQYNVLHLSCHGTANLHVPLNNGLVMSDGVLTLRSLLNVKLVENNQGGIRLAVLSACETGLIGLELIDEVISLPTGLLQSGIAGIVASLWSVLDLSTTMLLVRFYDFWCNDSLEPAEALRKAQQWVRDTSNGEKTVYFRDCMSAQPNATVPASTADYLYKSMILADPNARDFAHPFHWAAFSYVGT